MADRGLIWVRGAGEMGSACALVLVNTGFRLFISELEWPLAIRRTVTFSDAVYEGSAMVEDVIARRCEFGGVKQVHAAGNLPLVIDDADRILSVLHPDLVVDARLTKTGDDLKALARHSIGLGPGFVGGGNCDAAIETMRGHELGRILRGGTASPDTGTPGLVGGETSRRVLRSPGSGYVHWLVELGADVQEGETLGTVAEQPIVAPFAGRVRGQIHPRTPATEEMKIGDVDPRGSEVDYRLVSDKARAVGRAVLEAVLVLLGGA